MKKIFITAVVALTSVTAQAQDVKYEISGTAAPGSKWVYYYENAQSRKADSVEVKDGKFKLVGTKPLHTFISAATDDRNSVTVIVDGKPTTLNLEKGTVNGSAENRAFAELQKSQRQQDAQMMDIYQQYKALAKETSAEAKEKKDRLEAELNKLQAQEVSEIVRFAKANKKSVAAAFYLGQVYYALGYDELTEVLDPAAAYYSHPMMKRAIIQRDALGKRRPGVMYTDLAMNDMEGKTVKLSQWIGGDKYVLVDFWASWCGPCRMEMPTVVDAYKRYHAAKGFEVIGVSLDSKEDAWKKGVSDLGLPWPQLSDLQGWKCAAVDIYGITSIPSNILIDSQGKIVAADLRGAKLGEKLKEIYGF